MQVLKLDKNCEDAMQELFRVRTQQLIVSICLSFHLSHSENVQTFCYFAEEVYVHSSLLLL